MADTMETLEIEVQHKASGAVTEIDKLSNSLLRLNRILAGVTIPKLNAFSQVLDKMRGVQKAAAAANADMAQKTEETNEVYTKRASVFDRLKSSLSTFPGTINRASKGFTKLTQLFNLSNTAIGKMISSFKRVAFYRIIRAFIKAITNAAKEGMENAYKFSSTLNTIGKRFAEICKQGLRAAVRMRLPDSPDSMVGIIFLCGSQSSLDFRRMMRVIIDQSDIVPFSDQFKSSADTMKRFQCFCCLSQIESINRAETHNQQRIINIMLPGNTQRY